MKGVDVSVFQGNIDWNKAKQDGVGFAVIRAGYGRESSQVDKCFHTNIKNAQAKGIPVGSYWYSYALSSEEAKKEAKVCLDTIKGYQLEYPVCFDIEDKSQLKLSNRQRTDIVKAFCEEVEKAGFYAMFYCNLNWLNNYLIKDELKQYDLWLAQWGAAKPSTECGIWQKSDKGHIGGIGGNVDLNESFKDYPAIMKAKGLNGFSKSGTEQNKPMTYTIQKGDTLTSISAKFNVSIDSIVKLNSIKDRNKIYINQVLRVK